MWPVSSLWIQVSKEMLSSSARTAGRHWATYKEQLHSCPIYITWSQWIQKTVLYSIACWSFSFLFCIKAARWCRSKMSKTKFMLSRILPAMPVISRTKGSIQGKRIHVIAGSNTLSKEIPSESPWAASTIAFACTPPHIIMQHDQTWNRCKSSAHHVSNRESGNLILARWWTSLQ